MAKKKQISPIRDLKEKNVRFATIDLEASDWIDFIVVGFYDIQNDYYRYFEDLSRCLDFAFEYCKLNEIPNIFAHFGGKYDFNFTLCEQYFRLANRYTVDSLIPRGSGILCYDVFELGRYSKKDFKLTFRDSSAIFANSLKNLAKSLQVETQKGSVDFRFIREAWEDKDYTKKVFDYEVKVKLNASGDEYKMVKPYKVFYKKKEVKKFKDLPKNYDFKQISYYDHLLETKEINWFYIDGKKEVLDYLEADCVALAQCIKTFYESPMVRKSGPAFTAASQAVRVWRTFLNEPVRVLDDEGFDDFIRKAYLGGRTEVFKTAFDSVYIKEKDFRESIPQEMLKQLEEQNKVSEVLYYFDVNSLYPYVMKEELYPDKVCDEGMVKGKRNYNKTGYGVWEVEVDVPKDMHIPPLGLNHTFPSGDIRYVFPTGRFRGHWTIAEIEYAKSIGVKVRKYIQGLNFENPKPIFKDFIEDMYATRLEAKRKGDGAGDLFSKLMMNSTYGKLGMLKDREQLVINDFFSPGLEHQCDIFDAKSDEVMALFKRPTKLDYAKTNVIIPTYVTSYARIHMHKNVLSPCKENIFYTDTDSVQTNLDIFKQGKALGELKLESKCKSACFLLPKTYTNENIYDEDSDEYIQKTYNTMKGFESKKTGLFKFEDFFEFLSGEAGELSIFQDTKFATLKSALRRGSFLEVLNDPELDKKRDIERLKRWERMREDAKNKYDDKNYKAWLELNKKPVLKKEYTPSKKRIKSKYTKRIINDDKITTTPIHLGKSKCRKTSKKN